MNYFAHGCRYVDRPYFLAGTACPDWLSAVDRKVRLRARNVGPFIEGPDELRSEIAAGVSRHLEDDDWFHGSRAFAETTGHIAVLFRKHLGPDDGFRPGFLGHIAMELLLDAVLISRNPGLLDRYYEAVSSVEPDIVESAVNAMCPRSTENLSKLIPKFVEVRFLADYVHPERLMYRVNQVLKRVGLPVLDQGATAVFEAALPIVESQSALLLPPDRFSKALVEAA
ncbi:hypothetical protein [Stratiformator vulcanicus]|uniref:Uncharacterized protein n=1 Tax=Stratiformator vulcanicus TaxID=2527980 RepID=A0A517R226_9PLAN|nr:hypothetical protein [Stratiformator vulcanicus]QDT37922.1 hypothetical protein Pan189_23050 [Stratiformator vulcanicus]